ncbi:hypothetical protein L6164_026553 [Bauhinia variegata]|uniref:Uncharacterized protein n=1 Tax=Bauhinia variegata TaxID=167791 RepID=A0ACB9LQR8_BAUVA|nr:hypothetical protein L6164_026553 [Bauhinia variegata]
MWKNEKAMYWSQSNSERESYVFYEKIIIIILYLQSINLTTTLLTFHPINITKKPLLAARMGNTESTSNNTGGGQNNRNQSNPSWTEIASDFADLCTKLSSSSSGTFPNSNSQFLGLPSSSSSASAPVSDSTAGWRFPGKGWIKCNIDGSFLPIKGSAGCGGVYRDAQGNWLYGFSKKLVCRDLTTAEIEAIYTGLKVAWERGYKKIIIESDSTAAVDHVNKVVSTKRFLAETVNQAREYLNKDWEEIKIVHLPRDYNKLLTS